MALKLNFSSLSLGASVDQQTGSLSVFDVIEEIRTHQVPLQLQSLVIALCMEKTVPAEASGKVYIHVFPPDGNQALLGQGELNVPAEQNRMKAVFRFGAFPLHHFGSYRIVVSWTDRSGKKEGEALFDFAVTQVAQVAQGAAPAKKPEVTH